MKSPELYGGKGSLYKCREVDCHMLVSFNKLAARYLSLIKLFRDIRTWLYLELKRAARPKLYLEKVSII